MADRLDAATIDDATDRFYNMSPVKDALTAASVDVELETDRVPVQPGVRAACDFFGLDP